MISLTVSRDKNRYVLEFKKGQGSWFMFLDDKVYNDPLQFSKWMQGMMSNLNNVK